MNPKRMHTLISSAAVTTALSLSVASCASFDPNPAATGQAPVAPSSSAAPATPGAQPGATTPSTAPVAMTQMKGLAEVGGKAIGNARVQVLDAFTGKPVAGLVAAGAGNYDLAQAGELKTDAAGNFAFSVPDIGEGGLLKVVVTTPEGVQLTSLVTGSVLDKPAGYALSAFAKQTKKRTDFNITVNVKTTVAEVSMRPIYETMYAMVYKPASATSVFAANLDGNFDNLLSAINLSGGTWELQAYQVLIDYQETGGTESTLTMAGLTDAFNKAGIGDALSSDGFTSLVATAFQNTLAAAEENGGLNGASLTLSKDDFPPALNINLDNMEDGKIIIEVDGTEIEVIVDVIEVDDFENLPDFTPDANFKQVITVEYNENAGDTAPLALTLTQPSDHTDVGKIVATISKQWVASFDLDAEATINDPASTEVTDGWATVVSGSNHTVTATGADTPGSFTGLWEDENGVDIATVKIKELTDDLEITFEFAVAGNEYLKTKGGTATLEALKTVIALDVAKIKDRNTKFPAGNDIIDINVFARDASDTAATDDDETVDDLDGVAEVVGDVAP